MTIQTSNFRHDKAYKVPQTASNKLNYHFQSLISLNIYQNDKNQQKSVQIKIKHSKSS